MSVKSNLSRNDSSMVLSRSWKGLSESELSSSVKSFRAAFKSQKRDFIVVLVLFIINLLNYMDRYTITGLLPEIKDYYKVDDEMTGLLQTSFISSYMVCCLLFGYLGDRVSRKLIMICGVTFWSLITLGSSFVPKDMFWLFVVMRSLLGVGEASYSTVAPAIISDLFTKEWRTKLMAFFSFAIPIGSGLGFIIGFALKSWFGVWQAALRFTPIIGVVCLIMLVFIVKEPIRGGADGVTNSKPTTWIEDIKKLFMNPSFMFITFGFTVVSFVLGSLTWFAAIYMGYADAAYNQDSGKSSSLSINYIFGSMTVLAGFIGVILGAESGRRLRRVFPYADPLVCAFGLILGAPCFLLGMVLAKYNFNWFLVVIFIAQIFLCLNWALVTDMTMSVVNPSRRASAAAFQMIVGHALGDAGSPYFVGMIKSSLNNRFQSSMSSADSNYYSMQYAMLINAPILVIGGLFFVCASFYITDDKFNVNKFNSIIKYAKSPATSTEVTRIITM